MKKWLKLTLLTGVVVGGFGLAWYFNQSQSSLNNFAFSRQVDSSAQPLEERTIFSAEDDVFLSFDIKRFLNDSEVKVEWIKKKDNKILSVNSKQVSGPRRIAFVAESPERGWQSGDYQVKVYLDGQLSSRLGFEVK
jgi:hypothetical protein